MARERNPVSLRHRPAAGQGDASAPRERCGPLATRSPCHRRGRLRRPVPAHRPWSARHILMHALIVPGEHPDALLRLLVHALQQREALWRQHIACQFSNERWCGSTGSPRSNRATSCRMRWFRSCSLPARAGGDCVSLALPCPGASKTRPESSLRMVTRLSGPGLQRLRTSITSACASSAFRWALTAPSAGCHFSGACAPISLSLTRVASVGSTNNW